MAQGADGLLEEREDPPKLSRPRRRSERLLDQLPPPLLERLLERGTFDAGEPSLVAAAAELEEPLDRSPWVAARACPASALVSCWKLSSSRRRKERALMKLCGGGLEVITGLT